MPDWATVWALIALAVIPTGQLGQLLLAYSGKRLGITPKDINQYQAATEGDGETDD